MEVNEILWVLCDLTEMSLEISANYSFVLSAILSQQRIKPNKMIFLL